MRRRKNTPPAVSCEKCGRRCYTWRRPPTCNVCTGEPGAAAMFAELRARRRGGDAAA